MMKCIICKHGDLRPGKISLLLERRNTSFVVKNVPADVCDNCGEEYVDGEVARDLLESIDQLKGKRREVELLYYDAA